MNESMGRTETGYSVSQQYWELRRLAGVTISEIVMVTGAWKVFGSRADQPFTMLLDHGSMTGPLLLRQAIVAEIKRSTREDTQPLPFPHTERFELPGITLPLPASRYELFALAELVENGALDGGPLHLLMNIA